MEGGNTTAGGSVRGNKYICDMERVSKVNTIFDASVEHVRRGMVETFSSLASEAS